MATKFTPTDMQNAVNLYQAGLSRDEISLQLGMSISCIYVALKRAGVIRPVGSDNAKVGLIRRGQITPDVVTMFKSGESVLFIAKRLNVSRTVICKCLADAGFSPRTGSDANMIWFGRATERERKAIVFAANTARRNVAA